MPQNNQGDIAPSNIDVQSKWESIIKSSKYANCNILGAMQNAYINNPYVQNDRLKRISSYPAVYDRDTLENALKDPRSHEDVLRRASWAFNYQIAPIMKMAYNYSEILLYNWYIRPKRTDKAKFKKPEWKKEFQFVHEYIEELNPKRKLRNITLQAIREGKAFVSIRDHVENGKVKYVDLQQLPSDYVKITYRTQKGYGISFDMMFFLLAGNSLDQYHPVFKEYWLEMQNCVDINTGEVKAYDMIPTDVVLEKSSSRFGNQYMYWKELPPDLFFVISFDDTDSSTIPVFASSFLSANDLATYRTLQQQLISLPLQSVMTAEIPMADSNKSGNYVNDSRLSPELILLFQDLFDSMAGDMYVKSFFAPMENFKIHNLDSNPNKSDVVGEALSNFYSESGLSALFTVEKRPSVAQSRLFSLTESQFMLKLYDQFEDLIGCMIKNLNLKFDFEFKLVGDIFTKENSVASLEKGLATGHKHFMFPYLAYHDMTVLDAAQMCDVVDAYGLYDKMEVLMSSFNSKAEKPDKKNGRPATEEQNIKNDSTAAAQESGTNTSEGRVTGE